MSTSTLELAEILDAIAESIVVLTPDGSTLYANRAVLDYTGLTMPDVLAGDFLSRLFHPEDVVRLKDPRHEGLSHGVPFEIEWRARRHDGQYRWFLVRYRPLLDDQSRVLRWYATAVDIDDRRDRGLVRILASGAGPGGEGRPDRCDRPPPRRNRYRQGAHCARDSQAVATGDAGVHPGELRGHTTIPHCVRALRSRKGRLHRRGAATPGTVRGRRRRHHAPR